MKPSCTPDVIILPAPSVRIVIDVRFTGLLFEFLARIPGQSGRAYLSQSAVRFGGKTKTILRFWQDGLFYSRSDMGELRFSSISERTAPPQVSHSGLDGPAKNGTACHNATRTCRIRFRQVLRGNAPVNLNHSPTADTVQKRAKARNLLIAGRPGPGIPSSAGSDPTRADTVSPPRSGFPGSGPVQPAYLLP